MKLILGSPIDRLPGSIEDLLQGDFQNTSYGLGLDRYVVIGVIWNTETRVWASLARGVEQHLGWPLVDVLHGRVSPQEESL